MEPKVIKTQEEVEELKRQWEHDPIWDIEETEGFEEHTETLKAYRLEMEAKWKAEYEAREAAIKVKTLHQVVFENGSNLRRLDKELQMHLEKGFGIENVSHIRMDDSEILRLIILRRD